MAKKAEVIEVMAISPREVKLTLAGKGDLVLNQMNAYTRRALSRERNDKAKSDELPIREEDIITAIHWWKEDEIALRDGSSVKFFPDVTNLPDGVDRNGYFTEEKLVELLKTNAPCITAFGLKKSWMQAVTRYGFDTYSTKFDACVNVIAERGLVPITFDSWSLDERLLSPKRGSPILARINHFSAWQAEVTVDIDEAVYSVEQVINIINRAGYGIGIGSGRSSDYGRYRVTDVR